DTPASAEATAGKPGDVAQPFVVAGWAIDPDADAGTGVETLHVWAYPITCHGATCHGATGDSVGSPVFLGAAAYGGKRPDGAAIFGDRFGASGYGTPLAPL